MSTGAPVKFPTGDYLAEGSMTPVYRLRAKPTFSPLDINLQFIQEQGWSAADRLRFHYALDLRSPGGHPFAAGLEQLEPHVIIRRYDREEDSFVSVRLFMNGEVQALSNDSEFAQRYVRGLFLECPPSFHGEDELEWNDEWVDDPVTRSMFMGLLQGALGWDPLLQIPPAVEASLEEARIALAVANYRSCVVMCRRTVEALLKFAFPRLLGRTTLDKSGRSLTFSAMIKGFRRQDPPRIPEHLLHVLDSIRLIGNVPGAHPEDIEGYKFTKHDAEFALASVYYFLEQYFSKIDTEVNEYYTLTIDLGEEEPPA